VRTGQKQTVRLDFGRGVTNNEAEYRTLIAGLKDLVGRIQRADKSPADYSLLVHTDSQLMVGQVTHLCLRPKCRQGWQVKAANLRPLVGHLPCMAALRCGVFGPRKGTKDTKAVKACTPFVVFAWFRGFRGPNPLLTCVPWQMPTPAPKDPMDPPTDTENNTTSQPSCPSVQIKASRSRGAKPQEVRTNGTPALRAAPGGAPLLEPGEGRFRG